MSKHQTVLSVGQMKELISAVIEGIPTNISVDEAQYWIGNKSKLSKNIKNIFRLETNWLQIILETEHQAHKDFFGKTFDLSEFEKTLEKYGKEKIKEWKELGLEPHFLPKVEMSQNADFPGWKIKPEKWYFEQIAKGNVLRNINNNLNPIKPPILEGITVLIDTRLKPQYQGGKQMWENDNLLADIIEKLRRENEIVKYEYGPQSSRFGVSANEWEEQVKSTLAKKLELQNFRLETALEANVIPQMYPNMPRKNDGDTNTWCWYEEYFEDRDDRLYGGHSDNGGLANVYYHSAVSHWRSRSLRPLAVL